MVRKNVTISYCYKSTYQWENWVLRKFPNCTSVKYFKLLNAVLLIQKAKVRTSLAIGDMWCADCSIINKKLQKKVKWLYFFSLSFFSQITDVAATAKSVSMWQRRQEKTIKVLQTWRRVHSEPEWEEFYFSCWRKWKMFQLKMTYALNQCFLH